MKHQEDTFPSEDYLKIYYQSWHPDSAPKAVVQIIHGFGEHSGRYMNVVNELVPRGYAVYANDHRGHGKSDGIEMYVKKFENFVEDEKIFFEIRDWGIPFDPRETKDPDIQDMVNQGQTGGLGIFISRQLMNGFEYRREDNQNILIMFKKIEELETSDSV